MGLVAGGVDVQQLCGQLMGSLGRLGSAVSSALGAITTMVMILVIGIFIAVEPRLYQRGVAWMLPLESRDRFYRTAERMGFAMRRLMAGRLIGMAVEGVGTWLLLLTGGVPMAALLGILTGLLAFLPNIGAIISGVLIVLAGFSVGVDAGLWAIAVYFIVQTVDGYLIVPYVAKKTVDLAPALVLGAQLLFGALFGLMGLALADPIVAMIKTALEQKSDDDEAEAEAEAEARSAEAPPPRQSLAAAGRRLRRGGGAAPGGGAGAARRRRLRRGRHCPAPASSAAAALHLLHLLRGREAGGDLDAPRSRTASVSLAAERRALRHLACHSRAAAGSRAGSAPPLRISCSPSAKPGMMPVMPVDIGWPRARGCRRSCRR